MASAAILKQISSAFPDLGEALKKPLTDSKAQKAVFGVLDILLNARAGNREIRAVATRWSAFSDESGNSKQALEVFERLGQVDPTWTQAEQARCRLLLHLNRPTHALRLIDSSKNPKNLQSLRGLCLIKSNPKEAEKLLETSGDYVNLAALVESTGGDSKELWDRAVKERPNSLAALNGAKKFDETLKKEWNENEGSQVEFNARVAQALTGLGSRARDELFAVTAEGLFRSSISSLEKSIATSKKPVHSLELARTLEEYAKLLKKWEKREPEAEKLQGRAKEIRETTSSFLPSYAFDLPGWAIEDVD